MRKEKAKPTKPVKKQPLKPVTNENVAQAPKRKIDQKEEESLRVITLRVEENKNNLAN